MLFHGHFAKDLERMLDGLNTAYSASSGVLGTGFYLTPSIGKARDEN